MCHLILLMPVFGLPVFWLLPLNFALPIYIVIVLISGLLYWLVVKSGRKPVKDGFKSLIGTKAKVVSKMAPDHFAQYLVHSHGELWNAYSTDTLQPGEQVNILAVKGIGLVVGRAEHGSQPGK